MASSELKLLPLPKGWPEHLCQAFVNAVALARVAVLLVRGQVADSPAQCTRLRGDNDRLRSEVALLERELEIKDARMSRILPAHRPHYTPEQRLGILMLRAARGWSTAGTARRFLVVAETVQLWTRRCNSDGPDGLLKPRVSVNRFPEFVAGLVQELRATLPSVGRRRVADLLARAGLHLGATTVRRMLRSSPKTKPNPPTPTEPEATDTTQSRPAPPSVPERSVVARYPGHVWGCDLTVLPTACGFWLPWIPWSVAQSWPFAWWLLVVADHFSRCIEHVAVFSSRPSSEQVCEALEHAIARATGPPKYMVTDQGPEFGGAYRQWCEDRGVGPRFGAVGKHGSIAVLERVIRTLKSEGLRRILVPLRAEELLAEAALVARWYNEHRPHRRFDGATPAEMKAGGVRATELPVFETRPSYPSRRKLRAEPGVVVKLQVEYLECRRHLPIVRLRRVA